MACIWAGRSTAEGPVMFNGRCALWHFTSVIPDVKTFICALPLNWTSRKIAANRSGKWGQCSERSLCDPDRLKLNFFKIHQQFFSGKVWGRKNTVHQSLCTYRGSIRALGIPLSLLFHFKSIFHPCSFNQNIKDYCSILTSGRPWFMLLKKRFKSNRSQHGRDTLKVLVCSALKSRGYFWSLSALHTNTQWPENITNLTWISLEQLVREPVMWCYLAVWKKKKAARLANHQTIDRSVLTLALIVQSQLS